MESFEVKNRYDKGTKTYTLAEMKDKYIGKVGKKERDDYEYELRIDVLRRMMIKAARQQTDLAQEGY